MCLDYKIIKIDVFMCWFRLTKKLKKGEHDVMNENTSYSDLPDQTITFDLFDGRLFRPDNVTNFSYCQYEYYSIHTPL